MRKILVFGNSGSGRSTLAAWEPHKYGSKEAQDENLEMLIGWIRQYDERNDACSRSAHTHLYERFTGKKSMLTEHRRVT